MWTFEDAHEAITALQPESREFGFHLCLGGGVLNNGSSDKDLDLYFLPMDREESPNDLDGLVSRLEEYFGPSETLLDPAYLRESAYRQKLKFTFDDRRIDVFII